MDYHGYEELLGLGKQVRDLAVDVTAGAEYDMLNAMLDPDPRNPQQAQAAQDLPTREQAANARTMISGKSVRRLSKLYRYFIIHATARTPSRPSL